MLSPKIDTEALRASFQSATPFPHFVVDGFLEESFAREVAGSYPTLQDVRTEGREFVALNERGKIQLTDATQFPEPVQRLNRWMASRELLDFLERVTGIQELLADDQLIGGGMHATGPRGRLDVHVDFNRIAKTGLYRRLNLLIYLNEGWRTEWGGQIELWDKEVKKCERSADPILNRAVLFATSEISFHGVAPVTCPEGNYRKSFATYYYTVEAPQSYAGQDHSTIFRARPSEKVRGKVLMPLESLGNELERGMQHLKRVAKRIVKPEDDGKS